MTPDLAENPRAARATEIAQIIAETLDVVLRRGADANALDALDLLQRQVAGWGERRIQPSDVFADVLAIHAALEETARGAAPGTFRRIYTRETAS